MENDFVNRKRIGDWMKEHTEFQISGKAITEMAEYLNMMIESYLPYVVQDSQNRADKKGKKRITDEEVLNSRNAITLSIIGGE